MPRTILCLSSYFKGERFLERLKAEGAHVVLVTVEALLGEAWPRASIDEVYGLPSFFDRRGLINAVAYLFRTRDIERIVALDDFDVEVAGMLRDHFRMPGLGDSHARLFRDKLAMRAKAQEIGVRIPAFSALHHHDAVRKFLADVPGPWLVKPRSEASSIGIKKAHTADDVWRIIDALGDDQSFSLIEQMVPGELFHVDSLVADGRVMFAQPSQYFKPLLDVYQGGGVYASRTLAEANPDTAPLRAVNEKLLTGFGLDRGASHTEFMKAHADGQFYFIETSARVGGANIAEMVEAATGVNLWGEWAKLEVDYDKPYAVPPLAGKAAGVTISLARQEWPDTSAFTDPEIVYRLHKKQHIGFVVRADSPARVEELLNGYIDRIARDHHMVLPPAPRATA